MFLDTRVPNLFELHGGPPSVMFLELSNSHVFDGPKSFIVAVGRNSIGAVFLYLLPLLGEMIQFDTSFSNVLKVPTRYLQKVIARYLKS